jgi:hypothetical protein
MPGLQGLSRLQGLRVLAALAVLFMAPAAAAQEALALDAFFGLWEGSAIDTRVEASSLDYGLRDMDVRIAGTEDGFEIAWVTVIQSPGIASGAAADAEARRRSTTQRFVRVGPAVWEAADTDGPGLGRAHTWARLAERSLTVYVLEIDETGLYQLSRYERTITPAGVMDLKFTRTRDGVTVRRVSGSLMPVPE